MLIHIHFIFFSFTENIPIFYFLTFFIQYIYIYIYFFNILLKNFILFFGKKTEND